ncbi:MFS transporter [Nocardia sp. CDC160]|uniref:MFS transporter n=1 Tax=Nocardia sp. CDC160 TaxID=3112166 RepID=UPI002DB86C6C|nr:MFS transporter [Nocardia sp. CDC160]MEC3914651.1 MFS transporter [Nocardia sp. CDC160]
MSSPPTTEPGGATESGRAAEPGWATEPGWAPTGRTVAAVCAVGILVVGQLYVVLPVLNRLAADWDTSKSAATWTTTAFGLAYGAGFLVTGPLSDRWGRRPVIVGGLLATVLSSLLVAVAPGLATGLSARILQGLTASFFAPAAFAYLAERIAPARRIFALTCLTSSFLGAGVVAQVLAQLIGNTWGWHAIFIAGAIVFALSAALLRLVLQPPTSAAVVAQAPGTEAALTEALTQAEGAKGEAEGVGTEAGGARAEARGARARIGIADIARKAVLPFVTLLRQGRLALLYLSCLAILGSFVGIYTGIQLSPPEGVGSGNAALLALRASAIPAMVAVPLLAGRLGVIAPAARLITALAAAAAAAAITAVPLGGIWVAVWLFVFVTAIAVAAPAAVQAIAAQAGEARGTATALYTFALFVGASAGPQLANLVSRHGYSTVALTIAALAASGAALAVASTRVAAGTAATPVGGSSADPGSHPAPGLATQPNPTSESESESGVRPGGVSESEMTPGVAPEGVSASEPVSGREPEPSGVGVGEAAAG